MNGVSPVGRAAFAASLIFAAAAYALVWVQGVRGVPWPAVGAVWTWSLAVWGAAFGLVLLALWLGIPSGLGEAIDRLSERRGIAGFEGIGAGFAAVSALVCLAHAPALLPVPVLGGLGLAVNLLIPPRLLEVDPAAPLYYPGEAGMVAPAAESESPSEGWETRTFRWRLDDDSPQQEMQVRISLRRLEEFRARNPYRENPNPQPTHFPDFVTAAITGEVLQAATRVRTPPNDERPSPYEEVCHVLAFVQAIPYKKDEETTPGPEYFRFPIETLYDAAGDCEDTSILAAAVLRALAHDIRLIDVPAAPGSDGHLALAVAAAEGFPGGLRLLEGRYLYCETTHTGWRVGEVPPEYAGRNLTLLAA